MPKRYILFQGTPNVIRGAFFDIDLLSSQEIRIQRPFISSDIRSLSNNTKSARETTLADLKKHFLFTKQFLEEAVTFLIAVAERLSKLTKEFFLFGIQVLWGFHDDGNE